jgi:hypothetical protein
MARRRVDQFSKQQCWRPVRLALLAVAAATGAETAAEAAMETVAEQGSSLLAMT